MSLSIDSNRKAPYAVAWATGPAWVVSRPPLAEQRRIMARVAADLGAGTAVGGAGGGLSD